MVTAQYLHGKVQRRYERAKVGQCKGQTLARELVLQVAHRAEEDGETEGENCTELVSKER